MKITKIIAFILLFCMLSSLLLACDQEATETDSEPITEASTTKKTTASSNKKPSANYDKELPQKPATLPLYNGKDFTFKDFSLGQGSVMHIASYTSEDEYNAYLEALEDTGYELYTDNEIGENLYATYINETHILNIIYLDVYSQTRVICDERSRFDLPGLENENEIVEISEPSLTLLSDDAVGWPGRMGYIYKLSNGKFFIIDGGYTQTGSGGNSSKGYIMATLEKYADDPENIVVDTWLITHTHSDHLGGFIDMAYDNSIRSKITVERVIHNTPSEFMLSKQDLNDNKVSSMPRWGDNFMAALMMWNPNEIVKAHPGQVFYMNELKLTIYSSQDLVLGAPIGGMEQQVVYQTLSTHNDTCIVSMVEFQGKTALYLADSHGLSNRYVLDPVYNTSLQADIVQVAHHGYGDTAAGVVYQHISPSIVFWPVCKQHYDGLNHDGSIYYEKGSAYSGVMNVGFNKQYLFGEGVVHYYHGGTCITFSDFETWEGVRWDAIPD